MALTFETFGQLDELYAGGPDNRREALALAGQITPQALAAWLEIEVANPAAERYLLALFHGEGGVAAGNAVAYRRFYRELTTRRRPRQPWRSPRPRSRSGLGGADPAGAGRRCSRRCS